MGAKLYAAPENAPGVLVATVPGISACPNTEGSAANSDACTCDEDVCQAGLYCKASEASGSECTSTSACSNQVGSAVNNDACTCGEDVCQAGLYCKSDEASGSECRSYVAMTDADLELVSTNPSVYPGTKGWKGITLRRALAFAGIIQEADTDTAALTCWLYKFRCPILAVKVRRTSVFKRVVGIPNCITNR